MKKLVCGADGWSLVTYFQVVRGDQSSQEGRSYQAHPMLFPRRSPALISLRIILKAKEGEEGEERGAHLVIQALLQLLDALRVRRIGGDILRNKESLLVPLHSSIHSRVDDSLEHHREGVYVLFGSSLILQAHFYNYHVRNSWIG